MQTASSAPRCAPRSPIPPCTRRWRSCRPFPGRVLLVAAGKAAWQMASAAHAQLGGRISAGIVITKYQHAMGPIGPLEICEAGHPVPDDHSYAATQRAIELTAGLSQQDLVLLLISFFSFAIIYIAPAAAPRCLKSRWSPLRRCRM